MSGWMLNEKAWLVPVISVHRTFMDIGAESYQKRQCPYLNCCQTIICLHILAIGFPEICQISHLSRPHPFVRRSVGRHWSTEFICFLWSRSSGLCPTQCILGSCVSTEQFCISNSHSGIYLGGEGGYLTQGLTVRRH